MKSPFMPHRHSLKNPVQPTNGLSRRAFGLSIAALAVNGCAIGTDDSDSEMMQAVKMLWTGTTPLPVNRAYVAALPYATMLARLNNGPWALLVMGQGFGDGFFWYSAERQTLVTQGPWVTKTVGLETDIDSVTFVGVDPRSINLAALPPQFSLKRLVDSRDGGLFSAEIISTYRNEGVERVNILEIDFDLVRITEDATITSTGERMQSTFWIDPATGVCWQSTQYPLGARITVTTALTKPAG